MQEEICTAAERCDVVPRAAVRFTRGISIKPSPGQTGICRRDPLAQEGRIPPSVFDERGRGRIVAPLARVLDVQDIMTKAPQPQRVLQIVPEDPAVGKRRGETGDSDTKRRSYGESPPGSDTLSRLQTNAVRIMIAPSK